MEDIKVCHGLSFLTDSDIDKWLALFAICFKTSPEKAAVVFEKYKLHNDDAWFCLGYSGDNLVACYSGIERRVRGDRIFLSTDTMSSGVMKNATVKLGLYLYERLRESGVIAVCGFPNDKIIRIREKKLGWKMVGHLRIYVAPLVLWRWRKQRPVDIPQWEIERPASGFYGKPLPFTQVLGRYFLYRLNLWRPLVLTAATFRPGPFFIELPHKLVEPKPFGFRILSPDGAKVEAIIMEMVKHLDIQSIDVP